MIIKDLNDIVQHVFEAVVRHYTIVALAQLSGKPSYKYSIPNI